MTKIEAIENLDILLDEVKQDALQIFEGGPWLSPIYTALDNDLEAIKNLVALYHRIKSGDK